MTALLIFSIATNVVLLGATLLQRYRLRAAAVERCATCPFVTGQAARTRIPVPVYEEPKTLLLLPRTY